MSDISNILIGAGLVILFCFFVYWCLVKITQEKIINMATKAEILEIRNKLDKYCKFYDFSQKYQSVVTQENKKELDYLLKIFLSYLEGVALGVKHNIYDEDIVFEYMGSLIPEMHRWVKQYVDDFRKRADDMTIFIEFTSLAEKWWEKNQELKRTLEKISKTDGKKPL